MFERDWDNLILLDCCRYDKFKQINTMDGELTSVYTPSSNSPEFFSHHCKSKNHLDTVYVGANPFVTGYTSSFHDVVPLWEHDEGPYGATLPKIVSNEAISVREDYPNKRIIIHFMQPHIPFIGEFGRTLDQRAHFHDPWENLRYRHGDISLSKCKKAYDENLRIVLGVVEDLIHKLNGKSAVSADHGQLLGERQFPVPVKGIGHPPIIKHDALRVVPWFEPPVFERSKIVSETPKNRREIKEENIEQRLRDLGYKK